MLLGYLVASLFVYHRYFLNLSSETRDTFDSQALQQLTTLSERLSRSHID
jgi:hypothetical protein